jgi:hypothetical protein
MLKVVVFVGVVLPSHDTYDHPLSMVKTLRSTTTNNIRRRQKDNNISGVSTS